MAMKYIKFLYCGHLNGPKAEAVNEKVQRMSLNHFNCQKCHKGIAWQAEYGRIQVLKD